MQVNKLAYKKSIIADYITRRVLDNNKNFIAIVCGGTGSGKSYSALRLAQEVDPTFNIDNVAFTPTEFVGLINNNKIKRGSVIILDEGQLSMNSRDWYSVSNKLLNLVLTTFRNRNLVVFFTTPSFDYIDSQSRKLFHAYFQTKGIDQTNSQVMLKPYMLKWNHHNNKLYKIFLTLNTGDKIRKISGIKVGLPSYDLIKDYEDKKTEFTRKLNKEVEMTLKLSGQDSVVQVSQSVKKSMTKKAKPKKEEEKPVEIAAKLGLEP